MSEIETSQEHYWKKNFSDDKIIKISTDLQVNIARTKNGIPVDEHIWHKTIRYILELLKINSSSHVIELCCGNGVIIGEIANHCEKAVGVDYSKKLLNQLKKKYKSGNLNLIHDDVNTIQLDHFVYDTVIIYFSIQHFKERDALLLIEKSLNTLKVNGKLLIGDVPDIDEKWNYINKSEYKKDYFERVKLNRPKIGYWYQKDFFMALESYFNNISVNVLKQPSYQINSDHCFDVIITKNEVN